MNIQLLKKWNDCLPDSIKMMFAPIIRRKLIYNKDFQDQLNELARYDSLSEKDAKRKNIQLLCEAVIHAYQHTVYYREIIEQVRIDIREINQMDETRLLDEIRKIPLLTKEMIRDNFKELQADNIDNYYTATTGGSTGQPLTILLDKESIYREKAFIYHFWSKAGYDYRYSRIATFRGLEFHGRYSKVNPIYNEIILNPFQLNEKTFGIYLKKILKFRAEFLHGYPSAIFSFCKLAEKKEINLSGVFKAIFFISENVYQFERDYIERILDCKSYAFYGHSERAVFAEQSSDGYLFQPLYGYVEIGEQNEIICTGYINKKMPLIRYRLDDYAVKGEAGFQITGHHAQEILIGRKGERISAAMINFHSDVMDHVLSYQFVQNEKGMAVLNLILETGEDKNICGRIEKEVNDKMGGCLKVSVQTVSEIQLSSRGKYKMIIQNIRDING